jgi:hypothetical protein
MNEIDILPAALAALSKGFDQILCQHGNDGAGGMDDNIN